MLLIKLSKERHKEELQHFWLSSSTKKSELKKFMKEENFLVVVKE